MTLRKGGKNYGCKAYKCGRKAINRRSRKAIETVERQAGKSSLTSYECTTHLKEELRNGEHNTG